MKPRWKIWLASGLAIAVIVAAIYLPSLRHRIKQTAKIPQPSEEQARRELVQQPLTTNSDEPRVGAKLFWAARQDDPTLEPVTVELPLSNDPVVRAKQVLNTLLAGPVDAELRTLPPDAALLAFYLLPDGTAIADFSESLGTSIPSGIESEQMAVDSMIRTLEANVPQVRRLKILIHGQEAETLAGHLDLTETFLVNPKAVPIPAPAKPAKSQGAGAAEKLTPGTPPGKLAQPNRKP